MEKFDKLKELMKDKEFATGLVSNKTAEEAKAFLAENGVECSAEEVAELGKTLAAVVKAAKESDGELTEEQLQAIAGGTTITIPGEVVIEYIQFVDGLIHLPEKAWDWITSW